MKLYIVIFTFILITVCLTISSIHMFMSGGILIIPGLVIFILSIFNDYIIAYYLVKLIKRYYE